MDTFCVLIPAVLSKADESDIVFLAMHKAARKLPRRLVGSIPYTSGILQSYAKAWYCSLVFH